jgi:hypothetical protein
MLRQTTLLILRRSIDRSPHAVGGLHRATGTVVALAFVTPLLLPVEAFRSVLSVNIGWDVLLHKTEHQ